MNSLSIKLDNLPISNIKEVVNSIVKNLSASEIEENNLHLKSVSIKGVDKKQINLLDYKDKLSEVIKAVADKVKKNFNLDYELELDNCWTVISNKGSYHELHQHNEQSNNKFSTNLYLELPKDENVGDYYFVEDNKTYKVKPEIGMLLMVPIHLLHGTYPQGNGVRQTLNIDFLKEIN